MNQIDGVINVKDLFAELIRKAWIIILCTVLFAGVFGGYAYVQNKQSAKNAEEIEIIMTEKDIEVSNEYVEKVLQFLNMEDYMENSIIMNCNPYNVYQTELKYLISGDVDESDVSTIRSCYETYVSSGHLSNDIAEIDKDYTGKVLLDAIKINSTAIVQSDSLKIVSILVTAIDAEQTEELVAYVKDMMTEYSAVVEKEIGEHELVFLDETTICDIDYDFIKLRGNYDSLYDFLTDELKTYEVALSVEQKNYALDILSDVLDEELLEELEIEANIEESNTFDLIKLAVLGGVVGFAMSAVLIVALYFFTSQIKSEKEIEYLHGVKHIGNCPVYKSNALDRFADKVFYKGKSYDTDAATSMIVASLVAMCKDEKINELGFVGKVDAPVGDILENICKRMDKEGVKITLFENVLEENMKLPHDIINIELVMKTTMQEVIRTIEVCNEKALTLRGYITFSK